MLEVFSVPKITLIVSARDIMIVINLIVHGVSIVWINEITDKNTLLNINKNVKCIFNNYYIALHKLFAQRRMR